MYLRMSAPILGEVPIEGAGSTMAGVGTLRCCVCGVCDGERGRGG